MTYLGMARQSTTRIHLSKLSTFHVESHGHPGEFWLMQSALLAIAALACHLAGHDRRNFPRGKSSPMERERRIALPRHHDDSSPSKSVGLNLRAVQPVEAVCFFNSQ